MANKPPSFAALFRSPNCRRTLFVLCVFLVVYFVFKVVVSGGPNDGEDEMDAAEAYRTCIAKLGSVHAGMSFILLFWRLNLLLKLELRL